MSVVNVTDSILLVFVVFKPVGMFTGYFATLSMCKGMILT